MENYIQYSIMGSIGNIRIKPDCLPSKFNCQPDRINRTGPSQPQSVVSKRQRLDVWTLEELLIIIIILRCYVKKCLNVVAGKRHG